MRISVEFTLSNCHINSRDSRLNIAMGNFDAITKSGTHSSFLSTLIVNRPISSLLHSRY